MTATAVKDDTIVGPLEISQRTRTATLNGYPLVLTRTELALLAALARDPGRVYTKRELLRDVWGIRVPLQTRTLDSHACRLRAKLGGGVHPDRMGRRLRPRDRQD